MTSGNVQLWKVPSRVTNWMPAAQVDTRRREMEASRSGESARRDSRSICKGGRVISCELRGSFNGVATAERYPARAPKRVPDRARRRAAPALQGARRAH